MELKNFQLLMIAAVIFGALGISLIYFEVSSGFANFQIVQLAISAVMLIFVVGIFARSQKRITGNETESSSPNMKRSNRPTTTSESLIETTRQSSPPYWLIFVIGAFAELLVGVVVFSITEGRANNWVFLTVFIVGACVMLGLARWNWRQTVEKTG